MNFAEVAQFVTAHPKATVAGSAIGVLILWQGAKACIKAYKKEDARLRDQAERLARLPEPKPFIPPEQKRGLRS